MEFLFDWIEYAPVALLAIAVGLLWFIRPLIAWIAMQKMSGSNYVVFEAYPIHLPFLKADMRGTGWSFVSSDRSSGPTILYRFEKSSAAGKQLGDLIYKCGMPQTANRKEGADLLIKIASHGTTR